MIRSMEEKATKKAAAITGVFLDIGSVPPTDGWCHHVRKRVAMNFKRAWVEMDDRQRLNFSAYEEGKLTREEYLGRVAGARKRPQESTSAEC